MLFAIKIFSLTINQSAAHYISKLANRPIISLGIPVNQIVDYTHRAGAGSAMPRQ